MTRKSVYFTSIILCVVMMNRTGFAGESSQTGNWLILNEKGVYTSGVYTKLNFRADGEIRQGIYDFGGYELQTGGRLYVDDYSIMIGGLHIGGTSDPGQNNVVIDGKVAIGKSMPWADLDVDGDIVCDRISIGYDNPGSQEFYVRGEAYVSDELRVEDFICTPGGLHVGGTSDPGSDVLIVDGKVGIGTSYPYEALHVDGQIYLSSMNSTSSGYSVRYYNNRLYYESSSCRHKDEIRCFDTDFETILQIQPRSYRDRLSNETEIGYIAEELDALGLVELVVYNDGQPNGVKYDRIALYLLEMIKDQQNAIVQLKNQNNLLNQRITALEKNSEK